MSDAHLAAAQKLIAGVPGYEVRAEMEQTNVKLSSLSSTMSRVRSVVVEAGHRHADYEASTAALRAYEKQTAVATFLIAPLSMQLSTQRSHAASPSWPAEVEEALRQVKLLPSNMDSFCLSRFETLQLKKQQEEALISKNEAVITVPNAATVLKRVEEILESAETVGSTAVLAVCLLIASGRRTAEILNGRSRFEAVDGAPRAARFEGQAKKRGDACVYTIPLLVPYRTFIRALDALRTLQGGAVFSNRDASREYSQPLRRELLRCEKGRGALRLPHLKVHDLRSLYMSLVWQCYSCDQTFARTAMHCLGHVSLAESLSYSNVRAEDCDELANAYGPLRLHS